MSELTRTDVTAVKFYKNYILAGVGSTINIFEKDSTKLIKRFHALLGQKIYGFVASKCNSKILVFGGKQFTVVSVGSTTGCCKYVEEFSRLFEPVIGNDWLHCGVWLNEGVVALLTAHNVVQKWDISACTLISQHLSKDNSILYSGLLLTLGDDVLVMAGTVFSEVIVHKSGDLEPMQRLRGHKGVIFSISCDLQKGIIVTTSDDRSVRLWGPNIIPSFATHTLEYWRDIDIVCQHELYGHLARVMRNCIINNKIISVGEDSAICFWDLQGTLIKKYVTHQNGCIWSVDADNQHLITGSGDSGVTLHPLTIATDYCQTEILDLHIFTPKKVMFTARRNIVILNDNDELLHYDMVEKILTVKKLKHESSYKLLSMSSCKQLIAIADIDGKLDVFVESCKGQAFILNIIDMKLQIGKILSVQWVGNRHLVLCSENGLITVLAYKNACTEVYDNFILPSCKERWLTSSAIDYTNNIFVFGDRCGYIHVYIKGKTDPIKSFAKVHGRYGPTSIIIKEDFIITTGRDGTIKYFSMNTETNNFKYMISKDLEFQWVEKFLDKEENIICGFQERDFVVCDIKKNSKILKVPCGGGHRSWDAIKFTDKVDESYKAFVRLVYLKNSDIYLTTCELSNILSQNVINGSHAKEINCLKVYKTEIDNDFVTFYISGGEDTTLRISSINKKFKFQDEVVFKQLSSIRILKVLPSRDNEILLISAGGRAQLCIKKIIFTKANNEIKLSPREIVNYLIKGTDKERKGSLTWRNRSVDFDPETRIMDLNVIKKGDDLLIFAGCSDTWLRVFIFDSKNCTMKPVKELKHHKVCILKTHCIKISDKYVLLTCTTRGDIAFWDATNVTATDDIEPFFVTKTNKSGINSIASRVTDKGILIATGGDDNAIHLNLLEIDKDNLASIKLVHKWFTDKHHSSQVTGLCLIDNLMITASIDQRITIFEWKISDRIECDFLSQTYSDIADVQGMDVIEHSRYVKLTVAILKDPLQHISLSEAIFALLLSSGQSRRINIVQDNDTESVLRFKRISQSVHIRERNGNYYTIPFSTALSQK